MPRVSVIVPNYNHGRYLDQRLASIRGQSFADFEIIFLDDASQDDSREVFRRHTGDSRIAHAVFNETNSGTAFAQWNRGLSLARGDLVWIAESDDDADPELLATLVAQLEAHPSAGVACCQCWLMTDDGHRTLPATFTARPGNPWTTSFVRPGRELCAAEFLVSNPILNASGVVFRRAVAQAAGGADPSWRLCGDWKFWVDLLLRSDLAFVALPLNRFRCHAASVRTSSRKSGLEVVELYRIARYLRQRADLTGAQLATARWMAARRWALALRQGSGGLPPGLQARILVQALRLDPWVLLRLPRAWRATGKETAAPGAA